MYVNPIPYVDMGKEFEMRIRITFDDVVDVRVGKQKAAEYLKSLPVEKLAEALSCTKIEPVYPKEG